jgi:hypothetical protein
MIRDTFSEQITKTNIDFFVVFVTFVVFVAAAVARRSDRRS